MAGKVRIAEARAKLRGGERGGGDLADVCEGRGGLADVRELLAEASQTSARGGGGLADVCEG
jgi:hypothetical protein